jgi:hypothetical protein
MLEAKERIPTSFSVVFIFKLAFEFFRELGGVSIYIGTSNSILTM